MSTDETDSTNVDSKIKSINTETYHYQCPLHHLYLCKCPRYPHNNKHMLLHHPEDNKPASNVDIQGDCIRTPKIHLSSVRNVQVHCAAHKIQWSIIPLLNHYQHSISYYSHVYIINRSLSSSYRNNFLRA